MSIDLDFGVGVESETQIDQGRQILPERRKSIVVNGHFFGRMSSRIDFSFGYN
eukprot:Awhi_evm1s8968